MAGMSVLLLMLMLSTFLQLSQSGNFHDEIDVTFGGSRANVSDDGQSMTLSLDHSSGSGFQSRNEYLFGRVDVQMKLVPGNSAGTVTTFYLSSQGDNHDEIDFEFLGNTTGEPYTLHTNVYSQGKGGREQQFRLWFDPTVKFHTYSIVWNSQRIIFLVDNLPMRVFNNLENRGVAFPNKQPMRVYSSIWNADDWATQGGRVKTDWSKAPFTAQYRSLSANANVCTATSGCSGGTSNTTSWQEQALDAPGRNRIRWVQKKFMIYNYCTDLARFPQGLPRECTRSRFL